MTRRKPPFLVLMACLLCAASAHAEAAKGFRSTFFSIDKDRWTLSDGWANGDHQSCEWRADALSIRDNKLLLTLSDKGGKVRPVGCPEIRTKARLGHGLYEARMRPAAGSGLNTAFFTYIGPPNGVPEHDEIDFEFLGKAPRRVEISHHVNGKIFRGKIVDLGFDASEDFHDYAFDWSATRLAWFVDGVKVYETPPGIPIPRHPGFLFFSLWSGSPVEDSWMGPFAYTKPVTAEVAWARFTPHD